MAHHRAVARAKNIAVGVTAVAVIAAIIWIDLTTGVWNDLVILSGLAAGLVTFLLTVLVLDRVVERMTERRWAPVSRLALTEFLHALADDDRSEISRGLIVPRLLPALDIAEDIAGDIAEDRDPELDRLHALREQIVVERGLLAEVLSRWAQFLSSAGGNEQVLRHVAEIAMRLDQVRDSTLEVERVVAGPAAGDARSTAYAGLNAEIERCNAAMLALEAELRARILEEDRLAR